MLSPGRAENADIRFDRVVAKPTHSSDPALAPKPPTSNAKMKNAAAARPAARTDDKDSPRPSAPKGFPKSNKSDGR